MEDVNVFSTVSTESKNNIPSSPLSVSQTPNSRSKTDKRFSFTQIPGSPSSFCSTFKRPLLHNNGSCGERSLSVGGFGIGTPKRCNVLTGFLHRFSFSSRNNNNIIRCSHIDSNSAASLSSVSFFIGESPTPASSCVDLYGADFFGNRYRRATCTILDSSNGHVTKLRARNSGCCCDAKRREAFGYNYCCQPPRLVQRSAFTVDTPNLLSVKKTSTQNLSKTGQRSSSHYYLPPAGTAPDGHHDSGTGSLSLLSPNTHNGYLGGMFRFTTATSNNNINNVDVEYGNDGHFDDDREIDNRSVMHYELGFYEKTFATNCFRGTLTFQLRYDFIHRVLMLHVMKANHLPLPEDLPDAYIKMYCLPERRNHCKTRIFKKSCDPEFNEMFSFDVPYSQLANRMLQFTVYDFDRFTRHDLIGNVIMRDLFDKSDLYNWTEYTMQIVGSQEKNDFGDLLLYLAYSLTLKKLFITVSKAYNLRPMDITGASDPYVRVEQIYQRRRIKLRKTSIKRANLNPVYHECLEFDLSPEQIEETNFLVQVMDWDRIGRDDLLGCCVLGKESPTKEGRQQWEQLFGNIIWPFSKQQQQRQYNSNHQQHIRRSINIPRESDEYFLDKDSKIVHSSSNGNFSENTKTLTENYNGNLIQKSNSRKVSWNPNSNTHNDDKMPNGNHTMDHYSRKPSADSAMKNSNEKPILKTSDSKNLLTSIAKLSSNTMAKNSTTTTAATTIPINCNNTMHLESENYIPRAIGTWHSILGEVPEGFRNIPKAKK